MQNFADDARASVVRVLAYLGGLATLALLAAELVGAPGGAAVATPASRPDWIEVDRPHPAFATSIAGLADADLRYAIRRHIRGQGRKDVMAWGELGGGQAAALVEIYRPGTEASAPADAVGDVASIWPTRDLADGFKVAGAIDSKFGPVSLVDFAAQAAGGLRRCLGFAHAFTQHPLRLSGWYCNAGPEIVDRAVVACALDRLTLLAAGSDPKLGELFARAELKRTFCGQGGPIIAATPRLGDWIETNRAPRLRGRLAAR
jgi:hypothetical protein